MIKKVLIMNGFNGQQIKTVGLLSLQCEANLSGQLKVFNSSANKLVVKIGENMLIFDDIFSPENYNFSTIFHSLELPICAVLTNGEEVVAFGKSENFSGNYKDVFLEYQSSKTKEEQNSEAETKQKEKQQIKIKDELGEEVEIPYELKIQSKKAKSLSEDIDEACSFFDMIKPQVDTLFSKSEHFSLLEQKLENTEWVKVPYASEENDHYILGKIIDSGVVTHICYGVPRASINEKPPVGLEEYSQWLPLDDETGAGYWVMYQDAKTGENVVVA